MTMRFASLALALIGGATTLFMPSVSNAADVGYYTGENCYGNNDGPTITAAGHNAIPVATMDAASLSTIDILVINSCYATPTPDVETAVHNGLVLVWHAQGSSTSGLPGNPGFTRVLSYLYDVDFPAGSPVTAGPGGTLTNASLDNGNFSTHGFVPTATLPEGTSILATTASAEEAVTVSYGYGSGRVIYSSIPLGCYLPGGNCNSPLIAPAMKAYFYNILGVASNNQVTPTCAETGYTGTKLLWCQKICESGLTGKALEDWIHRWINRYRDLPTCAAGGGGEGEGEGEGA